MDSRFTEKLGFDRATDSSSEASYEAFKTLGKKRISFKIIKNDGTKHIIPFSYLLPFQLAVEPATKRTICSFSAGSKVVALMMENFTELDQDRFVDALGESELITIREWNSADKMVKEDHTPYFSQIMISDQMLSHQEKD